MIKQYVINRETEKLELKFEKEEYQEMSAEDKSLLKSAFLWSRRAQAWVSRAKNPNLWRAKEIAQKLGFEAGGKVGERLSYAEQMKRKAERAEARAERLEQYAHNAAARAEKLQTEFNKNKKDIVWLTQPNINSSAGRSFTRQRERVMARYEKGFTEYRKSEYFRDKAETAKIIASQAELENPVYLENRIKETQKTIRDLEGRMVRYENMLHDIEQGLDNSRPAQEVKEWIADTYEYLEAAIDKEAFFQNCLDEIGGIQFNKENLKPGYIVKMRRWGLCEIVKTNPQTVDIKIQQTGDFIRDTYAAIIEIVEKREDNRAAEEHPYQVGEMLGRYTVDGSILLHAYKIIKTTKKTITLIEIPLDNNREPMFDAEPIGKPFTKKPSIRVYTGKWYTYLDDWPLYKVAER